MTVLSPLGSALPLLQSCLPRCYLSSLFPPHPPLPDDSQAIAVLKGDSTVTGVITFNQEADGSPVTVSGDVSAFAFIASGTHKLCNACNQLCREFLLAMKANAMLIPPFD